MRMHLCTCTYAHTQVENDENAPPPSFVASAVAPVAAHEAALAESMPLEPLAEASLAVAPPAPPLAPPPAPLATQPPPPPSEPLPVAEGPGVAEGQGLTRRKSFAEKLHGLWRKVRLGLGLG